MTLWYNVCTTNVLLLSLHQFKGKLKMIWLSTIKLIQLTNRKTGLSLFFSKLLASSFFFYKNLLIEIWPLSKRGHSGRRCQKQTPPCVGPQPTTRDHLSLVWIWYQGKLIPSIYCSLQLHAPRGLLSHLCVTLKTEQIDSICQLFSCKC